MGKVRSRLFRLFSSMAVMSWVLAACGIDCCLETNQGWFWEVLFIWFTGAFGIISYLLFNEEEDL